MRKTSYRGRCMVDHGAKRMSRHVGMPAQRRSLRMIWGCWYEHGTSTQERRQLQLASHTHHHHELAVPARQGCTSASRWARSLAKLAGTACWQRWTHVWSIRLDAVYNLWSEIFFQQQAKGTLTKDSAKLPSVLIMMLSKSYQTF